MTSKHSEETNSILSEETKAKLSEEIKVEAQRLGFFACGIAQATAVDPDTAAEVKRWLDKGGYAEMNYMNNHTDKRLDPRLLMPGLKSIICVALNYAPEQRIPQTEFQLAGYAYGQDYHDVVKNKLRQLATTFGFQPYTEPASSHTPAVPTPQTTANPSSLIPPPLPPQFRVFCDSAPILERYWAVKAGLGWTGRNHQLIIPNAGSMFVLGELFLNIPLAYDQPLPNRCGSCHRCIDACPTGALGTWNSPTAHHLHPFDAARCLSYQTIENRGTLSTDIAAAMGNTIYGCDKCQTACPWNRFASPTNIAELRPRPELLAMTREKWLHLSEEDYQKLFKGSAVKRAKYSGLMRNITAVNNQEKDKEHPSE